MTCVNGRRNEKFNVSSRIRLHPHAQSSQADPLGSTSTTITCPMTSTQLVDKACNNEKPPGKGRASRKGRVYGIHNKQPTSYPQSKATARAGPAVGDALLLGAAIAPTTPRPESGATLPLALQAMGHALRTYLEHPLWGTNSCSGGFSARFGLVSVEHFRKETHISQKSARFPEKPTNPRMPYIGLKTPGISMRTDVHDALPSTSTETDAPHPQIFPHALRARACFSNCSL